MYDLLTRTVSQGLQGFLPIAFALTWFRRAGEGEAAIGIRWGIAAAVPATLAALYGFQRSSRQSAWEAALAAAALLLAIWFGRRIRSDLPLPTADGRARRGGLWRLAFASGATILIVRQAMEIAVALGAALELRARDPLLAISAGATLALAASLVWVGLGSRLPDAALRGGTRLFAALFAAQAAMYLFHESAEAGLLPWSDLLHAATEPYGPDGAYGRYVSMAVFLLPVVAALRLSMRAGGRRWVPGAAAAGALLIVAGIEWASIASGQRSRTRAAPAAPPPPGIAIITASPHILFRHTGVDPNHSRLSVTPLEAWEPGGRAAAALGCERVSYAAGHGLCLTTDRGVFLTYKAVIFDAQLTATHTIALAGSPTRTRVSPDGRVGAVTVFVSGAAHKYASASFSTKTTILDLATGDELGELESFATWRDGKRIKAADFNFWGVTFARDSNVFYATLKTAGTTYLVRGDLGLRKLTVLRDNVECPALSPDNRLLGFKKRIGTGAEPWRFYVLDLATLTDRPIAAETRSVDDQLEWLDDSHVLYGVPRPRQPSRFDVWTAPVDGSGPARIYLPDAESPIIVR